MSIDEASFAHEQLVQLKQGNDEAFDLLYARFWEQFHNDARKRGLSPEDAEDAVQVTFMKIKASVGTYQEERKTGLHWMRRFLTNTVYDIHRAKGRAKEVPYKTIVAMLKAKGGEEPFQADMTEEEAIDAISFKKLAQEDKDLVYKEVEQNERRAAQKRALEHASPEDLQFIWSRLEKPGPRPREYEEVKKRARAAIQEHLEHDPPFHEGGDFTMSLQIDYECR